MAHEAENKDVSAQEMALRETGARLEEVLRNLPRAATQKPEKRKFVHYLRVASRQSEAALRLYADFLPTRPRQRLEKQLKEIRRAAGKARDLDVLIALLKKERAARDLEPLLKMAHFYRRKAQDRLARAGTRAQQKAFKKNVRRLMADAAKRRSPGGVRFAPLAHARLRAAAHNFFLSVPPAGATLRQLHAFRLQVKDLRYRMEMLETAFSPAFKKDLLPRIEDMQERLGNLNDIASRRRMVKKWLSRTTDRAVMRHLRAYRALDTARLARARADFSAWCTPAFLRRLRLDFDSRLPVLALVAPKRRPRAA